MYEFFIQKVDTGGFKLNDATSKKFLSKNTKFFTTELSEIKEKGQLKNKFGYQPSNIESNSKDIALNTSDSFHDIPRNNLSANLVNLYIKTMYNKGNKVDYSKYICLEQKNVKKFNYNKNLPRIIIKELETSVLPQKLDIYKNIKASDIIKLSKISKPNFKYQDKFLL